MEIYKKQLAYVSPFRKFSAAMSKINDKKAGHLFESWTFGKINYILFSGALVLIISGYVIMARGSVNSFQSLTLAPIMLFLGYIVMIPIALIYRKKNNSEK